MAALPDASRSRQVVSPTQVLLSGGRLRVMVDRLAPGVVLVSSSGLIDGESAPMVVAELESELRLHGRLSLFVDMRRSHGTSIKSREQWSSWLKSHRGDVDAVVVLLNNKLVEMALSIVAMIVGGGLIQVLSSEPEFLKQLQKRVPSLLRMPRYGQLE